MQYFYFISVWYQTKTIIKKANLVSVDEKPVVLNFSYWPYVF